MNLTVSRLLTFERSVGEETKLLVAQGGGKSFQNQKGPILGLGGLLRCMADRAIR